MRPLQPVSDFIRVEAQVERIIGLLKDIPRVHVSRFGVIPKQGQPGKWRLILDLSNPHGCSINDGIVSKLCSIKYTTVDNAVQKILQLGRNTLLATRLSQRTCTCTCTYTPFRLRTPRHVLEPGIVYRHGCAIWTYMWVRPKDLLGSGRHHGMNCLA